MIDFLKDIFDFEMDFEGWLIVTWVTFILFFLGCIVGKYLESWFQYINLF